MFCVQCGAENPEDANFCQKCGRPIVKTPPITSPAERPPSVSPAFATALPAAPAVLEIRPKAKRNAIILAAIGVAALGGGVIMLTGEDSADLSLTQQAQAVLGIVSALACLWFAWKLSRRPISLVLYPDRAEYIFPVGRASIPWRDIQGAGLKSVLGIKSVGLVLGRYDSFINSMSPELIAYYQRTLPLQQIGGPVMSKLYYSFPLAGALGKAMAAFGLPDVIGMMAEMHQADSIEGNLKLARKYYGYDIWFIGQDLDRSPADFLALIEQYRARVGLAP